jgi:nucleotidyltransferase/DNA polymerase involved in DNA repair
MRICGTSLSSSRGVAVARLSAPLLTKHDSLGCDRQCLLFERNTFALTLCSYPDFPRYRAVSGQVREILMRHTDLIEPLSLDEAYLDVSENKTGLPTATHVARTIREQIRSELKLTASAGVAPNKFLAKIASDWRKPDGLFAIQPEAVDSFLLPLPVGRLPGVGKVMEEKLKSFDVQTVGDLRGLELAALEGRFGRYGVLSFAKILSACDFNSIRHCHPQAECDSTGTS